MSLKDAVSKAKELSPDLIILDVRMPGLNGVEVAGILRYALPKIRIVLVTMFAEDFASKDKQVVNNLYPADHLRRPVSPQ